MSNKRMKRGSTSVDIRAPKRARTTPDSSVKAEETPTISFPVKYDTPGLVLTLGSGDTGQLGLGPDVFEKSRPARFSALSLTAAGLSESDAEQFVQIIAGGMHTVCLSSRGHVYTFGCNDEGALGRDADLDPERKAGSAGDETTPALVHFPEEVFVTMLSAGDSHSAALDNKNRVWIWGTFRGSSGPIGLTKPGEIVKNPILLDFSVSNHSRFIKSPNAIKIVKIVSGQDHLACLSDEGHLYTMGCAEQGQLGRIAQRFCKDGGRSGIESFLQPAECRTRGSIRFSDVWAGGFSTFAKCSSTGVIYVCGLNNYGQLALLPTDNQFSNAVNVPLSSDSKSDPTESEVEVELLNRQGPLIQYMLTVARGIPIAMDCKQIAVGIHHTLILDGRGTVYAMGRPEYGRLGFGENIDMKKSVSVPTKVCFEDSEFTACWIGAGEACSYAVESSTGKCYSWGMGNSLQLSQDGEDDVYTPQPMKGKNLTDRKTIMVDAGGQHAVMLAYTNIKSNVVVSEPLKVTNAEANMKMDVDEAKPGSKLINGQTDHSSEKTESIDDNSLQNGEVESQDKLQNNVNNVKVDGAGETTYPTRDPQDSHNKVAKNVADANNFINSRNVNSSKAFKNGVKCISKSSNKINSRVVCVASNGQERDATDHQFMAPISSINKWSIQENSSNKSSLRHGESNFSSIDLGGESLVAVAMPQQLLLGSGVKRTYSVPSPPASTVGSVGFDILSTAATINTTSETSSVLDIASCGMSNDSSASSSLCSNVSCSMDGRSARCTDGGGSSRRSSLGCGSAQSSLLLLNNLQDELNPAPQVPVNINLAGGFARNHTFRNSQNLLVLPGRRNHNSCNNNNNSATIMSSICSTSSEPGFPTDTASFGSMTASPYDVTSGEASSL